MNVLDLSPVKIFIMTLYLSCPFGSIRYFRFSYCKTDYVFLFGKENDSKLAEVDLFGVTLIQKADKQ